MTLIGHYPYSIFPNTKRPVLSISIINEHSKKHIIQLPCLVDTGADFCMLPSDFADLLGHDLKTGTPIQFGGIGGSANGYIHSNLIEVGGFVFKCDFVFSDNCATDNGILGHDAFFNNLIVVFNAKLGFFSIYQP